MSSAMTGFRSRILLLGSRLSLSSATFFLSCIFLCWLPSWIGSLPMTLTLGLASQRQKESWRPIFTSIFIFNSMGDLEPNFSLRIISFYFLGISSLLISFPEVRDNNTERWHGRQWSRLHIYEFCFFLKCSSHLTQIGTLPHLFG